jgi:antitoxin VapB
MAMNIKNEEAHRLAREIAELTGQSVTEVVLRALREQRARFKDESDRAEFRRLSEEISARIRGVEILTDSDLYDEMGLPR